MASLDARTITLPRVRLSYCNLFQPRKQGTDPNAAAKYGATVLLPKSDAQSKALIDSAIAAAVEAGVQNPRCWNGIRPPMPALPIHDGDGGRPSDGMPYGTECQGQWVFTASNKDQPGVVDRYMNEIIDPRAVYSGIYAAVSVTFYAYSNTKKGVGCQLNHVMKLEDGEPLGSVSTISAADAFAGIAQAAPGYPPSAMPAPAAPAAPGYPAPAAPAYQAPGQAYAPTQTAGYVAPAASPGVYPQVDPATGEVLGYFQYAQQ